MITTTTTAAKQQEIENLVDALALAVKKRKHLVVLKSLGNVEEWKTIDSLREHLITSGIDISNYRFNDVMSITDVKAARETAHTIIAGSMANRNNIQQGNFLVAGPGDVLNTTNAIPCKRHQLTRCPARS